MALNDSRPVNLDLTKFSFPITAIASITHRACAVATWFGLGFALFIMSGAETDPLVALNSTIHSNGFTQFITWGILSCFGYYCAGTIKHLIQELGYFEDFAGGKMISWAALGLGALLAVIAGVYLWA